MLYMAQDLATALYETLIRDRFDYLPHRILEPNDYDNRVAVNISTRGRAIRLIDLTSERAIQYGVPTEVVMNSTHDAGQDFAEFVHEHMLSVDGIRYLSRFTRAACVAVFDRAKNALSHGEVLSLGRTQVQRALMPWNIRVG